MKLQAPTLYLLCAVLVIQLVQLNPALPVPDFSYGSFAAQQLEKVKKVFSYKPKSAQYVATEQSAESLIFVGDILLARNVEYLMQRNGASYPFAGIDFGTIGKNPAVVGNFESAIPVQHVPTPMGMIKFSVSPVYLPALRAAGVTHVSLANNHSLDFGRDEFDNAIEQLESRGIETFGHQSAVSNQSVEFIEVGEKVIAVVAVHTLHTIPSYSELKELFGYASARSDWQIVYVHWGAEYVGVHNTRQREAAERFVAVGADLIVGHHPHVVQDIEIIDGVPVFYSLGNYIFDQYDSPATKEGLLLLVDFTELKSVSLIPVTSAATLSQPREMTPKAHAVFLDSLAKRSEPSVRPLIRSGSIPLP